MAEHMDCVATFCELGRPNDCTPRLHREAVGLEADLAAARAERDAERARADRLSDVRQELGVERDMLKMENEQLRASLDTRAAEVAQARADHKLTEAVTLLREVQLSCICYLNPHGARPCWDCRRRAFLAPRSGQAPAVCPSWCGSEDCSATRCAKATQEAPAARQECANACRRVLSERDWCGACRATQEAKPRGTRELADAVAEVERDYPLPRCKHGKALRDHSGEALEPSCGCRAAPPQESGTAGREDAGTLPSQHLPAEQKGRGERFECRRHGFGCGCRDHHMRDEIDRLRNALEAAHSDVDRLRENLESARRERDEARTEMKGLEGDMDDARQDRNSALALRDDAIAEAAEREAERDGLIDVIDAATRALQAVIGWDNDPTLEPCDKISNMVEDARRGLAACCASALREGQEGKVPKSDSVSAASPQDGKRERDEQNYPENGGQEGSIK